MRWILTIGCGTSVLVPAAVAAAADRSTRGPIQMTRIALLHSAAAEALLTKPGGLDFDHDGKREFGTRKSNPPPNYGARLEFYESTADNLFVLAHVLDLTSGSNDVAVLSDAGDADGDGLSGVVVLDKDYHSPRDIVRNVKVFESATEQSFPTDLVWESPSYCCFPQAGLIADADGDGEQEIVIPEPLSTVTYYENAGDDSYVAKATVVMALPGAGYTAQSVAVMGDVDGDGRQEVFYGGIVSGAGRIKVIESTGDDTYAVTWSQDITPGFNVTFLVDAGDLDGDGKREVLLGGYKGSGISWLHVLECTGNDAYQVVTTLSRPNTINAYTSAAVADVDGDGKREIVFATTNSVALYRNVGDNAYELIWSGTGGPIQSVGAGDHDQDGKDELIFREGGEGPDSFTGVWEIDPAYAADADGDDRVDVVDNCPTVANPGQEDADSDLVGDACDNCAYAANPTQGPAVLGQTLLATGPSAFGWSSPAPVVYVRGPLDAVATYGYDLLVAQALSVEFLDAAQPGPGAGFYYLVKPDCGVGSWQSSPGAEPGRDSALP
jgi:hypothetical protein